MTGSGAAAPLGATLQADGVHFRLWAPHARRVAVIGSFNGWDPGATPMQAQPGGYWEADHPQARPGDPYNYWLQTDQGELTRIDPYAREVTSSTGNGVIHDPHFDWQGDAFRLASWNELVIYELHVGTFNDDDPEAAGHFITITARLDHLKSLGVNAIQIMPVGSFAGLRSWGYNPSHIFAVEADYGGSLGFKQFIKRAHLEGIAVILDVVYSHFGPSDLDLWQFDGWSENGRGGIYFYNDDRGVTPWGETRPDYGRGEVRQYILDNVRMWLDDYHLDGLRLDGTFYMRSVNGENSPELADGWSLLQAINEQVAREHPDRLMIAEDIQSNPWLTRGVGAGGAGFGSQWDPNFVRPIRAAMIASRDEERSLARLRDAILYRYNDSAFERVIFSESHDDVANGQSRLPQDVNAGDPQGWHAQKRSTLAAALALSAPGIPMLFQGQEFLEGGYFRDTVPLDWDQREEFRGIVKLYRDLVRLRLNRTGHTRGLCGQFSQLLHLHEACKVLAFHRWDQGGPGDDTVVIANFHHEPQPHYLLGFPAPGAWRCRFNSDWHGYSELFAGYPSGDCSTEDQPRDGMPVQAAVSIGPYSVLIYSQDCPD